MGKFKKSKSLFRSIYMKKFKIITALLAAALTAVPAMADNTITWTDANGTKQSIDISGLGLDDDLLKLVNDHKSEISTALTKGKVSKSDADTALAQAKQAYAKYGNGYKISNPYTTVLNGLDDFTDKVNDTVPNTQIQQNVWADSWIGHILPKPNFGFGINAGVSKFDLTPLAKTAKALSMGNAGDVPTETVLPTITVDARVGGFMLPFDVGFTAMSLDSEKLGLLNKSIDPGYFDLFMIGGDVRYAILEGGILRPKLSAGLGVYHTSGNFGIEHDGSKAQLDFSTTSLVLTAQTSIKLLFFTPFAGARVMLSNSSADWKVHANWANLLNTNNDAINKALAYGILPSDFSGGTSSGFFSHVRPVLFGGFAVSFLVVDLTVSGSYDFISAIPSGAVSLRLSI